MTTTNTGRIEGLHDMLAIVGRTLELLSFMAFRGVAYRTDFVFGGRRLKGALPEIWFFVFHGSIRPLRRVLTEEFYGEEAGDPFRIVERRRDRIIIASAQNPTQRVALRFERIYSLTKSPVNIPYGTKVLVRTKALSDATDDLPGWCAGGTYVAAYAQIPGKLAISFDGTREFIAPRDVATYRIEPVSLVAQEPS